MDKIKFPFGPIQQLAPADGADMSVDVHTKANIRIAGLGAARTVTIVVDPDMVAGEEIHVDVQQGATGRNVTLAATGATLVCPALTGVANDRDTIDLVYDGTWLRAKTAAWQKIVDAA